MEQRPLPELSDVCLQALIGKHVPFQRPSSTDAASFASKRRPRLASEKGALSVVLRRPVDALKALWMAVSPAGLDVSGQSRAPSLWRVVAFGRVAGGVTVVWAVTPPWCQRPSPPMATVTGPAWQPGAAWSYRGTGPGRGLASVLDGFDLFVQFEAG